MTDCDCEMIQNCQRVLNLLQTLSSWIDEIPPISQPTRFGNRAFRTWHARLVERAPVLLSEMLHGPSNHPETNNQSSATVRQEQEISSYLLNSFGSEMRIDYGTGHEFNFLLFECEHIIIFIYFKSMQIAYVA